MWKENRKYQYGQGCDLSCAYSNVVDHDRSQPWAYGGTKAACLDGGEHREPVLTCGFAGAEEDGGSAVTRLAAVARGGAAACLECWLELGERCHGGALTDAIVGCHCDGASDVAWQMADARVHTEIEGPVIGVHEARRGGYMATCQHACGHTCRRAHTHARTHVTHTCRRVHMHTRH